MRVEGTEGGEDEDWLRFPSDFMYPCQQLRHNQRWVQPLMADVYVCVCFFISLATLGVHNAY